jgi:GT2 family glycosyltransferase
LVIKNNVAKLQFFLIIDLNNRINIILITYNKSNLTIDCLNSIYKTCTNFRPEIIIVDNCSTDDTISLVEHNYPDIKIIKNPVNYGYAKAINIGLKDVDSDYVIVSNNDIIFHNGTIEGLTEFLENNNNVGLAGAQQIYPNGKLQLSSDDVSGYKLIFKTLFLIKYFMKIIHNLFPKFSHWRKTKKAGYIDGAVMAINLKAYKEIGGFDEDFFFFSEESDFCYRLKKAGWQIFLLPYLFVTHFRGSGKKELIENEKKLEMLISGKVLFCKKHYTKSKTGKIILLEIFILNLKIFALKLFGKNQTENIKLFTLYKKYWKKELDILK